MSEVRADRLLHTHAPSTADAKRTKPSIHVQSSMPTMFRDLEMAISPRGPFPFPVFVFFLLTVPTRFLAYESDLQDGHAGSVQIQLPTMIYKSALPGFRSLSGFPCFSPLHPVPH